MAFIEIAVRVHSVPASEISFRDYPMVSRGRRLPLRLFFDILTLDHNYSAMPKVVPLWTMIPCRAREFTENYPGRRSARGRVFRPCARI